MYDTFVRDRLPPPELLPEFRFDLPELQYPERLNAAAELLKGGAPDALAVSTTMAAGPTPSSTISAAASRGCWSRSTA